MTLATPKLSQSAQIVAAYEIQHGSALVVDMTGGDTSLFVEDLDDFADSGGELSLASLETADQTSEPLDYVGLDRAANRILLAATYDASLPLFVTGDSVWISPAATERRADVALDGEEDQIVVARIPYSLAANFPLGVRNAHSGEWVRVIVTEYGYAIDDALLEYPKTDPDSISITDPDTGEEIGSIGGDASFDTVTADEIISPSVPRRNYEAQTVYVDPVAGSDDNDGTGLYPALDLFERNVATPSWGTSDSGHAWTVLQSDGAVDVGVTVVGSARLRTPGASNTDHVRSAFAPLDVEISATLAPASAYPAAGTQFAGVTARTIDVNNWVGTDIATLSTGVTTLELVKRIGGGNVVTVSTLALGTFPASTEFRIRFQCQTNGDGGTDIRVKCWPTTGGVEADDWQLTANVADGVVQTPAGVGCYARTGSAVTNAIQAQYRDFSANVIDGDGNVVVTEATGVGPLATISNALELAGEWNDADVRLILSGIFDESVFVNGLAGGGRVFIDGANASTVYGVWKLYGVTQYFEVRNVTVQDSADAGVSGTFEIRTSRHVELINVKMQSNSARGYNVFFAEGADGRVQGCQLSGATQYCVQVAEESTAFLQDNSGSASVGAYRAAGGIIFQDGTKPTGSGATTLGGQIFGTITTSGGGTPPPTSTKVTKTYTPNASRTWRPEWGWKNDTRDVYQGEYAGSGGISRGAIFYGTKLNVAGKTADSGKIFVKRKSEGGSSGEQAVYLFSHDLAAQPSGSTAPGIKDSGYKLGTLSWGEGKWFDIPKGWVQSMLDGAGGRRGFGLYHASASPYVIATPYNGGGDTWKVKFTFH